MSTLPGPGPGGNSHCSGGLGARLLPAGGPYNEALALDALLASSARAPGDNEDSCLCLRGEHPNDSSSPGNVPATTKKRS